MIRDDADVSIEVKVLVGLPASSSSDTEEWDRKIGLIPLYFYPVIYGCIDSGCLLEHFLYYHLLIWPFFKIPGKFEIRKVYY